MKIRRQYELTIRINGKPRVFTYEQATAYETLEFMEQVKDEYFNIISWVFRFLNEKCKSKRPFWRRENVTAKEFSLYALEFDQVFETIQRTHFFGSFSKEKTPEGVDDESAMPFDAYLTLLSDKLNIDPLSLLKSYTFEQIAELGKGIVYVMNMQTEEGRKKNEHMRLAEKMKNIDRDKVAETLEKLEKWKEKHLSANNAGSEWTFTK